MRGVRLTALLLAGLSVVSAAGAGSPYRYDDDLGPYISGEPRRDPYDELKYVPLGGDPYDFVSFGADLRERLESANVQLLGFRYRKPDTVDLHRLLVYADLHLDQLRIFVQAGDELATRRKPSALPTDVDRLDLAQGFVDYRVRLFDHDSLITRIGRFEMSFDDGALISLRDGPNTRQTWEGIHGMAQSERAHLDIFAVKPVNVNPGWFDDNLVTGQSLWGLHVDLSPVALAPVQLSAFYYGNTSRRVLFSVPPGSERTDTFGIRARGELGGFDGSAGAMIQTGSYDRRPVRAWSSHLDSGWTFVGASWTPRLGLRADVLSGGRDDQHGTVRTFNALYPNYSFSTEAAIESPANLIQSGATLDLKPIEPLSLQYKIEGLWRYSLADAFYGAPGLPLARPSGPSLGRYSGSEQQLHASWQISRFVNLTAAFVHFNPGGFLRASGALAENFGMTELSVRL